MEYEDFLKSKAVKISKTGFDPLYVSPVLFDFQIALTKWAIKKGRSALWAGTGLGKTIMQLTWAENVLLKTKKPVLILAPLGVTAQTKLEGKTLLNLDVKICESGSDIVDGINITNYQKLHKFDSSVFAGIVMDESSILKNFAGKIRTLITDMFRDTEYKLCCSATPSPNDYTEIGTHAEFLNVCTRAEMLATYFIHDSGCTQKWRLKGHAEKEFFKWISRWAVMIEKPSDIGFDDKKMELPPLNMFEHVVESKPQNGEMFVMPARTLNERRQARRGSLDARCQLAADFNNNSDEIFLNWCDLNDEGSTLKKMIPASVEVKGADKNSVKEKNMLSFAQGDIKSLITKPKIAAMGLNLQACHNMCFVGLSDSFEAMYQAIRRCYRFGQKHPVNVHIIISEREGNVLQNIKNKEANAKLLLQKMVKYVSVSTIEELKKGQLTAPERTQSFIKPKFI